MIQHKTYAPVGKLCKNGCSRYHPKHTAVENYPAVDQIMEETGITMYRLKKIKKIIYEYMKSENYEENVRDVVGGSYERRNDQHQPAQDPGVIRSGGNDSVYNV